MIFYLLVFFQMLLAPTSEKVRLTATMTDIETVQGKLAIQILDADGEVYKESWIPVTSSEVTWVLEDISEGSYALKYFHDENNNGELDMNWMGIPTEGFGFSNDAKIVFGPPSVKEMLFTVQGDTSIKMKTRKLSL